jgi:glycosyltransferase involved in cell wall biosynthesis
MKKVKIILCTFNGGKFLNEQLDSISAQTYKNWSLYISDDGSSDNTLSILHSFRSRFQDKEIKIYQCNFKNFATNFIETAKKAYCPSGGFYAFCDQDDIWHPKKLERAITALMSVSLKVASLYCSRTLYITAGGAYISPSYLMRKAPTLSNALVQSIAGGNTMVFNDLACSLLIKGPPDICIPSHDWWLYILVTSIGGYVVYDPKAMVYYRQHNSALIGGNKSLCSKLRRLIMALSGRYRNWNQENLNALENSREMIPFELQRKIDLFRKSREAKFPIIRLIYLFRSGVYRQTYLGTLILYFGCLIKKI